MKTVVVYGSFDDLRSPQVRFLQEASRLGPVHVLLWADEAVQALTGKPPKFSQDERRYLVQAVRYVDRVSICGCPVLPDALPSQSASIATIWAVQPADDHPDKADYCRRHGLEYRVIGQEQLAGFPQNAPADAVSSGGVSAHRKKVLVTGCFDWFHSGHVRFFEEVSELGDLYVCVGHDANIRLLKGAGHPLFPQEERRYLIHGVRFVHQALVATGDGWLDAEPEIERLGIDVYAVNEDGDRPEKRRYCEEHGIEYRVLKRTPKAGLPKRQSTDLRGF